MILQVQSIENGQSSQDDFHDTKLPSGFNYRPGRNPVDMVRVPERHNVEPMLWFEGSLSVPPGTRSVI